ncbi:MAG: DUF4138 domain-containing protein [Bacteroidales bacterium]
MKKLFLILFSFYCTLVCAQDTIIVAMNKTVHIAFSQPVKYCDVGSHSVLVAQTTEQTSNILRLKAQEPFSYATNFSVITAGDKFYSFTLLYQENITQFLYDYRTELATLPLTITEPEPAKQVLVKGESIVDKIYTYKRRINHIGYNYNKLLLACDGIYAHRDTLYFAVSLENNSPLTFTPADLRLQIEDKQSSSRSASQITSVSILAQKGDLICAPKNVSKAVLVIAAISLNNKQTLTLYAYEEKGNRNLYISILQADIMNAITL